jgi:hypothetical protein
VELEKDDQLAGSSEKPHPPETNWEWLCQPDSEDVHLAASQNRHFWEDLVDAPPPSEPKVSVVDILQRQSEKSAAVLSEQFSKLTGYFVNQNRPEIQHSSSIQLGLISFPLAPIESNGSLTSIFGPSDSYDGFNTKIISLFWSQNLRQFDAEQRRAAGVYMKIRLIEKTCQSILGYENVASVRLQANDLSSEVVQALAQDLTCTQLWPQVTPVDFDLVKLLVLLPREFNADISLASLRDGLCQLRKVMQLLEDEICILCSSKTVN